MFVGWHAPSGSQVPCLVMFSVHICCVFMNVCFVLSLFFCLPFLCIVWLQIHCGSTIASGTSRSPHYCAPLVCVFNLQRKLLVWQLNQPKPILLLMEPRNRKNFSAQIGSSLTAPLDSIFKQSSFHCLGVCLKWYLWHMKLWWRYTPPYLYILWLIVLAVSLLYLLHLILSYVKYYYESEIH